MNQEDRAAVPMFEAFTNHPDTTPYTALPNQVPLTLGVPTAATATAAPATGSAANVKAAAAPRAMRSIAAQWAAWSRQQHFSGHGASEDRANPAPLNRVDWCQATGWKRPYPRDHRILAPDQVPGRNRPASDLGDG
jgi:hypothetical protein